MTNIAIPANLTADNNSAYGWRVTDSEGGVWWPGEVALERIEDAWDRGGDEAAEALALLLCHTDPMSGEWSC